MHALDRPQIKDVDLEALGWLMSIPEETREHFVWYLQGHIKGQWWAAAEPPEKPAGWLRTAINADIARTGRAFIRAIEQRGALSTPSDQMMLDTVGGYLLNVKAPERRKRDDKLASFIELLLIMTYALGGSASVNRKAKTGKKGNVVDLLEELRPLLPCGFIPKALPIPLIERLTAKARRGPVPKPSDTSAVIIAIKALIEASEPLSWFDYPPNSMCPNPACPNYRGSR